MTGITTAVSAEGRPRTNNSTSRGRRRLRGRTTTTTGSLLLQCGQLVGAGLEVLNQTGQIGLKRALHCHGSDCSCHVTPAETCP